MENATKELNMKLTKLVINGNSIQTIDVDFKIDADAWYNVQKSEIKDNGESKRYDYGRMEGYILKQELRGCKILDDTFGIAISTPNSKRVYFIEKEEE